MNKEVIGKRIRYQRESFKLTREQFAERIGISPQFLTEIELGKKGMSAETLYKICEKGEISADTILFGERIGLEGSPAVRLLGELPSEYHVLIEDVIRSFRDAIILADKTDQKNNI